MSRVLLLCPERLGLGRPAGVGIRFLEFARALRAGGHSVTMLTPDAAQVEGCGSGNLEPFSIRNASLASDVAVLQGHVSNDFFAHAVSIPTVVDLYDPYIIENLHYHGTKGEGVFLHDHGTLIRSLRRGDLFLCASDAQRLFYLGMLLAIGRLNPISFEDDPTVARLLSIVPFGVPPPRTVPARNLESPALLFGGIYDWYDPILAIDAVAIARERVPGLTLSFNRHPNAEATPQGQAAAAEKYVQERRWSEFVRFEPWTPYETRTAFYDRFCAAILTFPASIETDLAMRTRVLDYLWAGLPVISSPGRGTDEIIERHGAGRIVPNGAAQEFADAIVDTIADRVRYDAMVAGAASFARDHQWNLTLRPLLDFCNAPRADESREHFSTNETIEPARSSQHALSARALLGRIRRKLGWNR